MTTTPTRSLMPAWMPRFNKLVTNRIQKLWAPYLPPWAMVVHTGRRSGRTYAIPVVAFRRGNELSIALPYGSDAQWVTNVIAADGCIIVRKGKRVSLRNPRVVGNEAAGSLPKATSLASKKMGVLVGDLA